MTPTTTSPPSATGIDLDPRYAVLTVAYLLAIYRLSSIPALGTGDGDPVVSLLSNLAHVPLFAGLTFCVLKTLTAAREARRAQYAAALVTTATCAALDEWYQSLVPGRQASLGDLLLDLAGIGAVLLVSLALDRRRDRTRR